MYTWFQPIIDLLSGLLTLLYGWTQDWGAAVLLLTFAVRALLLYPGMSVYRQQVRGAAARPLLERVRAEHGGDLQRLLTESARVQRLYGVRPLASIGTALVQMPLLMAMYGLFLTHGSTMTSLLVPWLSHLAQADTLHVLPLAAGLLSLAGGLLPVTELPAPAGGAAWLLPALLLVMPVFVLWHAPAALGLYWSAGSLFAVLERLFYRSRPGRWLLRRGLPSAENAEAAEASTAG